MKSLRDQLSIINLIGLVFLILSVFLWLGFYYIDNSIPVNMEDEIPPAQELLIANILWGAMAIMSLISAIGLFYRFVWSRYCTTMTVVLLMIYIVFGVFFSTSPTPSEPMTMAETGYFCLAMIPLLGIAWVLFNEQKIHDFEAKQKA